MNFSLAHTITVNLDVLLSVAVCAIFSRPTLRKSYPWMFTYLCVRAVAAVIIDFVRFGPLLFGATDLTYDKIYFVAYWASCLLSAMLLFLSCLDVYRQAMSSLPGLARVGSTVFTWAAVASVVVTATTLTTITPGPDMITRICLQLLRCAGATELCLLALLLLCMKAIGLSPSSRPLGFALGLGFMAAIDCAESIVTMLQVAPTPVVQSAFEASSILILGIWISYSLLPQSEPKTVAVAIDSPIYRWDQIARVLGRQPTQIAVQPAPSSFLAEAERAVDRVFIRRLDGKESES